MMLKRLGVLGALGALSAVLAALPLASASSVESKLQIGFSLQFTGPDTSAGTFVASGAVEDSGPSDVTNLRVTPQGNQDSARLTGTQVFNGTSGSITTTFKGLAGPLSSPHQAGQGTVEIVSGTGAYLGLTGSGVFLVVVDTTTNKIIGTVEGQAN
jgi:hypothetical protein